MRDFILYKTLFVTLLIEKQCHPMVLLQTVQNSTEQDSNAPQALL